MVAVIFMRMVMNPASLVIEDMCGDNHDYGYRQQPVFKVMPALFCKQENYTGNKNRQWQKAVVMFFIAMVK